MDHGARLFKNKPMILLSPTVGHYDCEAQYINMHFPKSRAPTFSRYEFNKDDAKEVHTVIYVKVIEEGETTKIGVRKGENENREE